MGVSIPQVVTETKASGAQVIDGSLKFDQSTKTYLTRTPASAGNRKVWTLSYWIKLSGDAGHLLSANNDAFQFEYRSTGQLLFANTGSTSGNTLSTALFRDPNQFYHVVIQHDAANTIARFYINGEQNFTATLSNADGTWNNATSHNINGRSTSIDSFASFGMSQVYFIDGLALGPGYFGFTDQLTNTWRPKKFRAEGTTVNDGTVWSGYGDSNAASGFEWTHAFDGSFGANDYVTGTSTYTTITFPKPIEAENIYLFLGTGTTAGLRINGVQITDVVGAYNNSARYKVGTNGEGNFLETISLYNSGTQWSILYAIEVGGVIMRDSTTTNLDFGTNGFYLPMDANSPIGEDKSGRGNDWTPVNFGSSVGLDKATGALPILNTTPGGTSASVGVRTDAYANNLVLALPLVGNANDVSNSVNSGTTTKTVTVSGATASNAESNIYGGSFLFDGSNDEITVGGVSDDLDFGTGDYTAEAWFYLTGTGDEYILNFNTDHGGSSPHWGINIYSTNLIRAGRTNSSGDASHSVTHPFIINKWYHVAISRSGGISRLFLDGNLLDSESNSDDIDPTSDLKLGRHSAGGSIFYNGYIQDVRIYKGVGKYTESFNPPSTNPDILPDTPSGVSGGSKLTKVIDGAVSFDGSGDYLNCGTNSDFAMGSGDFTMECLIYINSFTSPVSGIIETATSNTAGRFCLLTYSSDKSIRVDTVSVSLLTGEALTTGKWYHIAVTRSGTDFRLFVDGKLSASATNSTDFDEDDLVIGKTFDNHHFDGFISNLRVIKGTALYTANFTPPTAPLTNVTNTKLLCCQSNVYVGTAVTSPNMGGVNDGTQWSNGGVGDSNWDSSFPIQRGFNGEAAYGTGSVNMARPNNANVTATWNAPGSGIPFSTLKLTAARDSGSYSNAIKINGVDVTSQFTASTSTLATVTITGVSSPLTKLELTAQSGVAQPRFTAIYIDDVILTDPVTFEGNAAATNFNPFTTDINAVRGQESGYCTWNPLCSSSNTTLSNGNLDMSSGAAWDSCIGTIGATSGKYYWEQTMTTNQYTYTGFCNQNFLDNFESHWPGQTVDSWSYLSSNGLAKNDQAGGSEVSVTLTTMPSSGGILGFALDLDNQKAWFALNGKWMGSGSPNPATGTDAVFTNLTAGDTYFPAADVYSASASFTFGQKPFKFPPPDGFQPLIAANVRPETVIPRSDQFVGVTTYTGTGSSKTLSDYNQKPDFVWIKLTNGAGHHSLFDSVRGATKIIYSNLQNAENTIATSLSAFNDKGFTVVSDNDVNGSGGKNYVAYGWKAGGSKGTFNVDGEGYASAAAAGLDGGLTVTGASVGTKQGFSIIKATGSNSQNSFKHGLGKVPKFVIAKDTDNSRAWYIYHGSLGANYRGSFDAAAFSSDSGYFGSGMTDTLVTLKSGGSGGNNYNGADMIYYVWADVPGLQKFGQFTGNNSADGVFVELGFKPAILLIKNDNSTGDWIIWDNERNKFNPVDRQIWPYTSSGTYGAYDQVGASYPLDFLSNGFKMRTTDADMNSNSRTYIYAAWAEAPSFNLYGAQSNAR